VPTDPSQATDNNPFDMPGLIARCLNDEAFARSTMRVFVQHIPELLAKLDAAVQSKDATKIADAAHTLKGAAGNAGATRVAAVAQDIETIVKSSYEFELLERQMKTLGDEFAHCAQHVDTMTADS